MNPVRDQNVMFYLYGQIDQKNGNDFIRFNRLRLP